MGGKRRKKKGKEGSAGSGKGRDMEVAFKAQKFQGHVTLATAPFMSSVHFKDRVRRRERKGVWEAGREGIWKWLVRGGNVRTEKG